MPAQMSDETATNVTGTCFDGADLRGVDLSQVIGLTVDQVSRAITDASTKLPEYLLEPAVRSDSE